MKWKFLIILLSFQILVLTGCCKNELEGNALGIEGPVSKVKLIKYEIVRDSTGNVYYDTSTVQISYLGEEGKLLKDEYFLYFKEEVKHVGVASYDYNCKNQIKKEHFFSIEDSSKFTVNYQYKGKLLQKTNARILQDETLLEQVDIYEYSNDKLFQRKFFSIGYDENKDTSYYQNALFRYDENELLENAEWYSSDTFFLNQVHQFNYDEEGDLYREIIIDKKSELVDTLFYQFEYDTLQNWVKKIISDNKGLQKIEERIIENKIQSKKNRPE